MTRLRGPLRWAELFLATAALCAAAARAEKADLPSIEQLMQVEVTTVSGLGQPRIASPAAVTVITADDIRRSGHRTVAEALRMVPGMYVAEINSSSYVVGARGLTSSALTATRYLVLIDGRVVYDPLFSSTFWDIVDVPLEDLERIEVIRGPGATLWGANAMNGVINIITRSARDTQGLAASGALGTSRSDVSIRFGATTARDQSYRVWSKYDTSSAFELPDGSSAHDSYARARAGFRVDGGAALAWTLSGDAYKFPRAEAQIQLPVPGRHLQFERRFADDTVEGANVAFGIGRDVDARNGWRTRAYYDHTNRQTLRLGAERDTFDVDYRAWAVRGRHQLVWGAQADRTRDRLTNGPVFLFAPEARSWSQANAFLQDTLELRPGRLFAMLGTKLTYHDFVGLQVQPSVRLWATPTAHQTLWAAVSRPVRVPSRLESDGMVVLSYVDTGLATGRPASGTVIPLGVAGDPDLGVEKLVSYELGHRVEIGERWAVDTTLFYNDYTDLVSVAPAILGTFNQRGSGVSSGLEIAASFRPSRSWRFDVAYSLLDVRIDGPVFKFDEGASPRNMAQVHAHWDLGREVEIDAALYHVDRVPRPQIPAYDRADLGLAWRPRAGWRLAVWGRNLFDPRHAEASGVRIPRDVYLQVAVGF